MTKAVVVGLGDIGVEIVRTAALHGAVDVVAAVDIDPAKCGRSLRDFTNLEALRHIKVMSGLEDALQPGDADVVVLSTSSRFSVVARQALTCFEAGASVVTTCEEMTYPWDRDGIDEIREAAERTRRAILGVGVNPGFVMDLLPAVLSMASLDVQRISIERRVDLDRRRPALRKKAGVGLDREEFWRLARNGEIGHVGLDSSARLVAQSLGLEVTWPLVKTEPIVGHDTRVVGFRQRTGWDAASASPAVELDLVMSASLDEEFDRIAIDGDPAIQAVIDGGISGDVATAALVINAVPPLLATTPGVKTVLDLEPLHAWLPRP